MQDPDCIFCKIVKGEIPSRKVFEDDDIFVFHDIRPVAPVHLLMIPKSHRATMYDVTAADAPASGRMMALAGKLARDEGADDGFRHDLRQHRPRRAPGSAAYPRTRDRRAGFARADDPAQEQLRRTQWAR